MSDPNISFDTLEAGAGFNQTYTYINNKINKEKQWNDEDNETLHANVREQILGMTPQERGWRLRQLLYEKTFKKVASQVDGLLGSEDNERAIRLADEELKKIIQQNRVESELHKRLHFLGKIYHEKNKKKWADEDHDRVRRHMLDHLASYHPDTHKAILRGAMVSTYMNDTPGSDAAVWIPGMQSEDGRLPGIAEKTIAALREINLLNEINELNKGVITYPSEIISEPSYQSLGIKNAWFGWYQDYAAKNDLPVPSTYKEMNKQKKKFARQEFKKAARDFGGQKVIIQEEENELIAYTGDGIRLGPISDQSKVLAGQEIEIKGSFARSGDLRIAMDPPQEPEIPKEETRQPEQLELDLQLPEQQLSTLSKHLNQIPGIGPKTSRKIIETFGDQALNIIENEPERLLEIPGIGQKRVEKIKGQQ